VIAIVLSDGTCPSIRYMRQTRCEARFDARFRALAQAMLHCPDFYRPLGDGVFEVKVDQGPGRRVFGCWEGKVFVVTHGADKPKPKAVPREVGRALRLFSYWKESEGLA